MLVDEGNVLQKVCVDVGCVLDKGLELSRLAKSGEGEAGGALRAVSCSDAQEDGLGTVVWD